MHDESQTIISFYVTQVFVKSVNKSHVWVCKLWSATYVWCPSFTMTAPDCHTSQNRSYHEEITFGKNINQEVKECAWMSLSNGRGKSLTLPGSPIHKIWKELILGKISSSKATWHTLAGVCKPIQECHLLSLTLTGGTTIIALMQVKVHLVLKP